MVRLILVVFSLVMLTGCSSGTKRKLGLEAHAPDEFSVISHPELIVPPHFRLRSPEDLQSEAKGRHHQTDDEIISLMATKPKASKKAAAHKSKSEDLLLKETGSDQVDQTIRTQVDVKDTQSLPKKDVVGRFKKAVSQVQKPTDKPLDPIAESKRLKQNKDAPAEGAK